MGGGAPQQPWRFPCDAPPIPQNRLQQASRSLFVMVWTDLLQRVEKAGQNSLEETKEGNESRMTLLFVKSFKR